MQDALDGGPCRHVRLQGEKGNAGAHWMEGGGWRPGIWLWAVPCPSPGCSGHRSRGHRAHPPCLPLCLGGHVGAILWGLGQWSPSRASSLPGYGGLPLLSTLQALSGPGRALSSIPPAGPAAMWQGGSPALGGPPRHRRSHMSGPPLRERGSCPVKFLWAGKWKQMQECCDILQDRYSRVQPQLLVPQVPKCPSFSLPLGQVLLGEGRPWRLIQGGLGGTHCPLPCWLLGEGPGLRHLPVSLDPPSSPEGGLH